MKPPIMNTNLMQLPFKTFGVSQKTKESMRGGKAYKVVMAPIEQATKWITNSEAENLCPRATQKEQCLTDVMLL